MPKLLASNCVKRTDGSTVDSLSVIPTNLPRPLSTHSNIYAAGSLESPSAPSHTEVSLASALGFPADCRQSRNVQRVRGQTAAQSREPTTGS
jgi:hypothetical protein